MKVQANHGKVTQNMHGASRNYRYVWDVSRASIIAYPATLAEAYICILHDSFIFFMLSTFVRCEISSILFVIYRVLPLKCGKDPKEDKIKRSQRGQNQKIPKRSNERSRKSHRGHEKNTKNRKKRKRNKKREGAHYYSF